MKQGCGSGSGAFSVEGEVTSLKFDRFDLDQGFPTAGNPTPGWNFGFASGEFQSWDFVLNVAVFNALVNAPSFQIIHFLIV